MMIPEHIVDLSDDDDIPILLSKKEDTDGFNKKLVVRPVSCALKNLGLSLIKMQYFNDEENTSGSEEVDNSENKAKDDFWQSAWSDDNKTGINYPLRHLLEDRYIATYRCVIPRSPFCQNQSKMTRINWLYHSHRGHFRINVVWRKILKMSDNSYTNSIFEILCLLCPEGRRKKSVSWGQSNYVSHVKRQHSHILPYKDYMAYFQRCFICNDQTKSFQQNLSHRKLCLAALLKDPNQVGTEQFNNCFRVQSTRPTLLLESGSCKTNNLATKLKIFNNLKSSALYFWLQLKKNGATNLSLPTPNGSIKKPITINPAIATIRQSIWNNKAFMNCKLSVSDRIAPGSNIAKGMLQKFFLPVPFLIKNETQSKNVYVKWRKSTRVEHSKIQSNAPWFCELCNAMMKNARSAYCHLRMCHNVTAFQEMTCKSCSKKFLSNQGYKNHFNGKKKCPVTRRCPVCSHTVSINDIYEHMNVQHKEQFESVIHNQGCLICRDQVDNLSDHLFDIHGMSNVIQGQKNVGKINFRNGMFFNCAKCSFTYFSEVELRNHMILNDHYLQCPHCPRSKFFLSWELLHHVSLCGTLSDHRFPCDLCPERSFPASSDLTRHYISCHLSPCSVALQEMDGEDI